MELVIIIAFAKLAQGTHATLEAALRDNKTGFSYRDNKTLGRCCIMLDK